MIKRLAIAMITFYRNTGGGQRWFGIDCNFEPTCSAYTLESIQKFGTRKGIALGWDRIRRCGKRDCICKCIEPVPNHHNDYKGEVC